MVKDDPFTAEIAGAFATSHEFVVIQEFIVIPGEFIN